MDNENKLTSEISKILAQRRDIIKQSINSKTLLLFWNIGKYFHDLQNDQRQSKTKKQNIHFVSELLALHYGQIFDKKGLSQMLQFYKSFPQLTKDNYELYLVDWDDILELLKVSNSNKQQFYFNLKIKQGLSTQELKQAIRLNKYTATNKETTADLHQLLSSKKNKKDAETLKHIIEINDKSITSFFINTFTNKIFPHLISTKQIQKIPKHLIHYESLINLINDYKNQVKEGLVEHFSYLYWEIGTTLNQKNQAIKKTTAQSVDNKYLKKISQPDENLFSLKELKKMQQFALYFPDAPDAVQVLKSLSRNQLNILLQLHNYNEFNFYFDLLFKQNLHLKDLKQKINLKKNKSIPTKYQSAILATFRQNLLKEVQITKAGNSIVQTTSIIIKSNVEIKTNYNILKNKLFLDLLMRA